MTAAQWRHPIFLAEADIAGGVRDVNGCAGYAESRLLVRMDGCPLGWVHVPCSGSRIPAADIVAALPQVGTQLRRELAKREIRRAATSAPAPPISVVICSRDRPAQLARALRSFAQLDYPAYELIVVDNASTTDETRQVVTAAGARYVREARPGLDVARNAGWTAATHDIVAFTDDDVEVDHGWLRAIAAAMQDPSVGFVTGQVLPARLETEAEWTFEMAYGGMGKGVRAWRRAASDLTPARLIATHHLGVGANMAFRRALLASLGGFDPALDVGTPARGGGDLDMFHRALMHGATLRYEPAAMLRHHHRRDMRALRAQHCDSGCAFGVYLLTILRRGQIPRSATVAYAFHWLSWLLASLVRRAARGSGVPGPLTLAEMQGALQAPFAYLRTYRQARRASAGSSSAAGSSPPQAPGARQAD